MQGDVDIIAGNVMEGAFIPNLHDKSGFCTSHQPLAIAGIYTMLALCRGL